MIKFNYPKEKDLLTHYAKQIKDIQTLEILDNGIVASSKEASHLSQFFWTFVDLTIEDIDSGNKILGESSLEEWTEIIMQTLRSHIISQGFVAEWEAESDRA